MASGLDLPLAMFGNKGFVEVFIWPGGGSIGLVLWALSIVMVALVIQAFLAIRRINVLPDATKIQVQQLFDNKQYREAVELTATQPDYLSYIVHASLSEANRGYNAMEKALAEAANERTGRLMRSIEYLNLLGNIGPMLGLLGTVYGMILAFFTIVAKGGAVEPAELAEALGIKLVCTFMGLVVAIPSLTVYGLMRNRIDVLAGEAVVTAQDMVAIFKPGASK
jgi:biopolymer transport protein ExbB